jgi:hypothetical protein
MRVLLLITFLVAAASRLPWFPLRLHLLFPLLLLPPRWRAVAIAVAVLALLGKSTTFADGVAASRHRRGCVEFRASLPVRHLRLVRHPALGGEPVDDARKHARQF